MHSRPTAAIRMLAVALAAWMMTAVAESSARGESLLLVEAASGKVLYADNAAYPWYPASITKIMTVYATLRAIREGRLTLNTLLTVSHTAAAQAPVKMGFPPGTTVTVDNALKMLLVKSANDMAVVLAEGVAGSIENFADLMNQHAQRLGMVQSHFVNPNGLPAEEQTVSARDMAILARAVIREFPEFDDYWHLPGIRFGKMVQRNYNTLIGRYPGADGMKTGFICASGFNLVATATRDGKRLIAVVLGAPSSAARAIKAAELLERGFTANPLAWLTPSLGDVTSLQPVNAAPPDLREEMCGKHRRRPAAEDEDDSAAVANLGPNSPFAVFLSNLRAPSGKQNLLQDVQLGEPVVVFTGSSPKKPAVSRTAAIDSKASPAHKAAATAAAKPAGKAGIKPSSPAPKKAAAPDSSNAATHKPEKSTAKGTPSKPSKPKTLPDRSGKPSHAAVQTNSETTDKK